jgi:Rieske 2Fe-2S family protein
MPDFAFIDQLLKQRRPGYSLPQGLYNDPRALEFDLEAVFYRRWLVVGFDVELPSAGSYLALTIGTSPIVIVRQKDGSLAGFFNSCRHRGAQVCENGHGRAARLVCPYHHWTYDLGGKLVYASRMGDDFDPTQFSLRPIHVRSAGGVLHVCLAEKPPSFDTFETELSRMLAPHNLMDAKIAHEATLIEKGNWKLVMENARECYHCALRHPELAVTFPTGAGKHFEQNEPNRVETFTARMERAGIPVGPVEEAWWQAGRFPLNSGNTSMTMDGKLSVKKLMCEREGGDIGSMRWAVEPHSFCHALPDYTLMFFALPLAPNETLVVAKWLVHKDAVEGVDYTVAGLTELWNLTNLQDRDLVENNQRGVNSIGYTPGPYSREAEFLVHRLVDWYCDTARDYVTANM